MREIKFRGMKDNDKGEWVYGYLTKTKRDYLIGENQDFMYWVKPETVGQFTGLNDRKGNPIYEGDILEDFDGEKWETITVKYDNGKFGAMFLGESTEEDLCEVCNRMTIVGNIYDNPELWEGEKL